MFVNVMVVEESGEYECEQRFGKDAFYVVASLATAMFAFCLFNHGFSSQGLGATILILGFILLASAPVMLLAAIFVRFLRFGTKFLSIALQIHAAIAISLNTLLILVSFIVPDDLGISLGSTSLCYLIVIYAYPAMMLFAGEKLIRPRLFLKLCSVIVGAFFAGMMIWSFTIRVPIISQAERLANDRPYCITISGHQAYSFFQFNGLWMLLSNKRHGTHYMNFYSVLEVESANGMEYWNWSFRHNEFQKMPVEKLRPEQIEWLMKYEIPKCEVHKHFISGLL